MPGPVLIVEDNDDIREILAESLSLRGVTVLAAENGRAAIDQVRRAGVRPLMIVLDMRMPVMDGEAFLAAQPSEPLLAHVPVVITTADLRRPMLMPPTVRAVLMKPIALGAVLELISTVAQERSMPRAASLANGTGATPERAPVLDGDQPRADFDPEPSVAPRRARTSQS